MNEEKREMSLASLLLGPSQSAPALIEEEKKTRKKNTHRHNPDLDVIYPSDTLTEHVI